LAKHSASGLVSTRPINVINEIYQEYQFYERDTTGNVDYVCNANNISVLKIQLAFPCTVLQHE